EVARNAAARRVGHSLGILIISAASTAATGIAGAFWPPAWVLAGVTVLTTISSLRRWAAAPLRLREGTGALARLTQQLIELLAARTTAQQLAGTLDDLPRVAARLGAAGHELPVSPERARMLMAALDDADAATALAGTAPDGGDPSRTALYS